MFTGIVQGMGRVLSLRAGRLDLLLPQPIGANPIQAGESIAVNGVCLTALPADGQHVSFDLSPETLARTALGEVRSNDLLNLERAMRPDSMFGGHIVQGHVDATGSVESISDRENSNVFRFQVSAEFDRYLIDKGSITVDGVSLTVVNPLNGAFDVWVIPHTLEQTNLSQRKVGDRVNLEFDVIAKYVEKLLRHLK